MKSAANLGFVLLSLLSFAGARPVLGAEPIEDGHERAKLMLSGRSFPDTRSRSVVSHSESSIAVPLDAQEQAREMILGHAIAKITTAVDAPDDRKGEEDPLEMARRMILGGHFKANSPAARLASKAE